MIIKKSFLHTPSGDAFETRKRSATGSFSSVIGRDFFFDGILSLDDCGSLHFVDTRWRHQMTCPQSIFSLGFMVPSPVPNAWPASCGFRGQLPPVRRRFLLHTSGEPCVSIEERSRQMLCELMASTGNNDCLNTSRPQRSWPTAANALLKHSRKRRHTQIEARLTRRPSPE